MQFLFVLLAGLYGIEALQASQYPKLQQTSTLFASTLTTQPTTPSAQDFGTPSENDDWKRAKRDLQDKDCCVVSIENLNPQLELLQQHVAENGPSDIDLRARIRTSTISSDESKVFEDCFTVLESVLNSDNIEMNKCASALQELAVGMASMAEGAAFQDENGGIGTDVFVRIVCASNYRAREPPYHTDKAPFRGYVTLRGVGTEYLNRPSSPLEYFQLRTFGEDGIDASTKKKAHRSAPECQFIVMKGDYYYDFADKDLRDKEASSLVDNLWARSRACVHRSPLGNGQRRVIISFDLDDGNDDREWYQAGTKREWRNGLTQRKSRLVA